MQNLKRKIRYARGLKNMDDIKKEAEGASKKILESYSCLSCKRRVGIDELYGAFGMCSQCLALGGFDDHEGG